MCQEELLGASKGHLVEATNRTPQETVYKGALCTLGRGQAGRKAGKTKEALQ